MKKLTMMALLACCVAAAGTAQTMAAETEADIISKVEEGNRGLTDQMSSVQKRIDTLMLQSNEGEKNSATGTPSKKLDVYDLAKNSTIGNVSLYICLKLPSITFYSLFLYFTVSIKFT